MFMWVLRSTPANNGHKLAFWPSSTEIDTYNDNLIVEVSEVITCDKILFEKPFDFILDLF